MPNTAFYICTQEHGYQGPFSTYFDAVRARNEQGYGDVIVRIDGVDFKLKPYF